MDHIYLVDHSNGQHLIEVDDTNVFVGDNVVGGVICILPGTYNQVRVLTFLAYIYILSVCIRTAVGLQRSHTSTNYPLLRHEEKTLSMNAGEKTTKRPLFFFAWSMFCS